MYTNRRNFPVLQEIAIEEHDGDLDFRPEGNCSRFAHAQWKIRNITVICGQIAEISASYRESGSRNSMLTSDFTSEMKCGHFVHAQWQICTITIVIYSRVGEISASYRKLSWRSSMVTSYITLATGQIPRSTSRIASFHYDALPCVL